MTACSKTKYEINKKNDSLIIWYLILKSIYGPFPQTPQTSVNALTLQWRHFVPQREWTKITDNLLASIFFSLTTFRAANPRQKFPGSLPEKILTAGKKMARFSDLKLFSDKFVYQKNNILCSFEY